MSKALAINFIAGRQFPIARTSENIRGRDILNAPEFAHTLAAHKAFSVSICNGRGEVWMKIINGVWQSKVDSCDKVFGFIRGKYRPV